jgi:hypothetical protein
MADTTGLWHLQGWHEGLGLERRQPFDRVMQRPGGVDTGLKACQVWLREDNTEATGLVKIDGITRELRKTLKELDAIGRERQQVLMGREIRRLAGRKRGRPTSDRSTVKQHNRLVPCRRELKGGTGTEYPTADNDDLRLTRNHTLPLRCPVSMRPQMVLKVESISKHVRAL